MLEPRRVRQKTTRGPARRSAQVWLAVAGALSCGHSMSSLDERPSALGGAESSYEILAAPAGEVLAVEGDFPSVRGTDFGVDPEGAEYVSQVLAYHDGHAASVTRDGQRWNIPACRTGCRIRYEYRLGDAARAIDERGEAEIHPQGVQAPPSTWLLRPLDAINGTRLRFHVTSAPGDAFATGVYPVPGTTDTYEAAGQARAFELPYAAFGHLRRKSLVDGHVEVVFFSGALRDEAAILSWVERSARAVEAYYGRPPVPRLLILLQPVAGDRVGFGSTMGSSGAAVEIAVGQSATAESLRDDWVLTHEMIHTALPNVDRSHHWLEEGLATYVEPIVRAQAGLVASADVWRDWLSSMPQGLPELRDGGLDRTHTWGRTYWGGALFCLEADIAIRERTGNRRSLRDALRAIVAEGGNISVDWPVEKILDVGDAATGVTVLRDTYQRMATRPERIDLTRLWLSLGVKDDGGAVVFDDGAPLAAIRRAMLTTRQ
jgi:hypothetical protein